MVWALHPGLPPTFAFLGFRFSFSQGLALGVRGFADEHSSGLRDSGTFPPSSCSLKVSGFATHDLCFPESLPMLCEFQSCANCFSGCRYMFRILSLFVSMAGLDPYDAALRPSQADAHAATRRQSTPHLR